MSKTSTKSDWKLAHDEQEYRSLREDLREYIKQEVENSIDELFDNLRDALQPKFLTQDINWIPSCAHEKDAGADLKAWISETKSYIEVLELSKNLKVASLTGQVVCLNGAPVNSAVNLLEELTDLLRDSDNDGEYRFVYLPPNSSAIVKTGFKIALPELPEPFTACYRVSPRSGLAAKYRLSVTNSPGLIDCFYRNDVGVLLENRGNSHQVFSHGARIAQGTYEIVIDQSIWGRQELAALDLGETVRKGGFGHTGI